jgi:hypothetical protein
MIQYRDLIKSEGLKVFRVLLEKTVLLVLKESQVLKVFRVLLEKTELVSKQQHKTLQQVN